MLSGFNGQGKDDRLEYVYVLAGSFSVAGYHFVTEYFVTWSIL